LPVLLPDLIATAALWLVALAAMLLVYNPTAALTQLGPDETKVTLSYDWSAVGPVPRQHIQFPPFTPDHLDNSLSHLAAIVAQ
jgi:hypothetical protein